MVIDAHSHLLQGRHPNHALPQSLDDLGDVDVDGLMTGLDELGIEAVVTLAQEMSRIRDEWLGSNELAADLQKRLNGRFIGIAGFEPITRSDQFNAPRFEQVREMVRLGQVRGLLITHYVLPPDRMHLVHIWMAHLRSQLSIAEHKRKNKSRQRHSAIHVD